MYTYILILLMDVESACERACVCDCVCVCVSAIFADKKKGGNANDNLVHGWQTKTCQLLYYLLHFTAIFLHHIYSIRLPGGSINCISTNTTANSIDKVSQRYIV